MTLPVNKTRTYSPCIFGTFHDWNAPNWPAAGNFVSYSKISEVESPLNLRHRKVHGKFISGGPWILAKREIKFTSESASTFRFGTGLAYKGRYVLYGGQYIEADLNGNIGETTPLEAYGAAQEYGAEAWEALKPSAPDFSAAQELYELRDLVTFHQQATDFVRTRTAAEMKRHGRSTVSHGSEWYLALQFGWLPVLNSVEKFMKTVHGRKKRFDQLLRDEGKWVKRSRKLKHHNVDESSETFSWNDPYGRGNGNMAPTHVYQCYMDGTGASGRRSYKRNVWCVGKFKYFLPSGPRDRAWRWKIYSRIFGLRLTPSQVYAVIPWSWLFDYFADLGHFMDAVSGGVEDRLICDYAYVMHHQIWTESKTEYQTVFSNANYPDWSASRVSATQTVTVEYKTRAAATVVGFGYNKDNLSPFQQSIIGALGLSRI